MNDWERKDLEKRQHERYSLRVKSLAWTTFALITGLTISCRPLTETYNRWRDRVAVEEAAERERLAKEADRRANHRTKEEALEAGRINRLAERDNAMEECIKALGLNSCLAIEERAYQACWYNGDQGKMYACLHQRLYPTEGP